jgi:hypothetical protein
VAALGTLALVSLGAQNGPIWRYRAAPGPVFMPMSDHRCLRVPLPMFGRLGRAK